MSFKIPRLNEGLFLYISGIDKSKVLRAALVDLREVKNRVTKLNTPRTLYINLLS